MMTFMLFGVLVMLGATAVAALALAVQARSKLADLSDDLQSLRETTRLDWQDQRGFTVSVANAPDEETRRALGEAINRANRVSVGLGSTQDRARDRAILNRKGL